MDGITERLGDEWDQNCLFRCLRALDTLGADRIQEWIALAGSQDITSLTFQVGPASNAETVDLVIETYMGIQLTGPRRWVEAIAREVRRPEDAPGLRAPKFCLIGLRPVMVVATPEGGLDILALNWGTLRFEREMHLMHKVLCPQDEEVRFIDSQEFRAKVEEFRQRS
jgi:hypothetical protein